MEQVDQKLEVIRKLLAKAERAATTDLTSNQPQDKDCLP